MPLTVHALDADDEIDASVSAIRAKKVEELVGEIDHAEVGLTRAEWDTLDADLDRRNGSIRIERPDESTLFQGRFDDVERGDGSVTLHVAGYEVDALNGLSTGANVVYQNATDSDIVTDLIDGTGNGLPGVDTLETGTVDTESTNLSMSFSNSAHSKALFEVARSTGAELRYNFNKTVDYLSPDSIGNTRSIELSPSEQSVIGEIEIEEDEREDVTHVEGFGAQSGPDQVTATGIATDFTAGDRVNARRFEDTEIKEESRLQEIVDRLVNEHDGEPRLLKIKLDTTETSLELGDDTPVVIPEEDINRNLRIITRVERFDGDGHTLGLVLSNRLWTIRDESRKGREDLQKFNRGYQGFVDRDQITSGWDVAGDGVEQELIIVDWPDDIVTEHSVQLAVQGRAWRSPVTVDEHDHEIELDDHVHSFDWRHQHTVDIPVPPHRHELDNQGGSSTVTHSTTTSGGHDHNFVTGGLQAGRHNHNESALDDDGIHDHGWEDESDHDHDVTVQAIGTGQFFDNTFYWTDYGVIFDSVTEGEETSSSGGTNDDTTGAGGGTTETTNEVIPLSPEVTTSFDGSEFFPSDVEIRVNGSLVDTLDGDDESPWTDVIDLSGELSHGLNTISASPATRGELNIALASELFRRGRSS